MIHKTIKQSICDDIANGCSISEVAQKHGVSKRTVYRVKSGVKGEGIKTVSHDLEVRELRRGLADQRSRYNTALDEVKSLQEELHQYESLTKLSSVLVPANWKIEPTHRKEVVAFTLASDWHIDENVDKAVVGGVNEYNRKIGKERIEWYFKYTLRLLNMCRKESDIRRLVVGALGDFMTGWIHEELKEDSSMTPPEAVVEIFELWINGLHFLLNEGDLEEIDMVCCCGNHSRITDRIQTKKSPKKTYEWLLYQFLAKWFAMQGETRIKFKLPQGYFNWLTVFDKKLRFHHGERIGYHGGVGGIHIPLRKAIAQWNKAQHADLDILAHWHTRETSRDYVINGSVIGYSEFAEYIKADYEPPQQSFFILHPKFGKTAEFPIVLATRQSELRKQM
jgi:transposase-like protein